MTLSGLLQPLQSDPALRSALDAARAGSRPRLDLTAVGGLRAPAIASIAQAERLVLAVTATGREAEDLAAALRSFLGESAVAEFSSWETLPHERLSPRSDTVGRRLAVLRRLAHPETESPLRVVVAPIRSVLQPQVAGLGDLEPVRLTAGQEIDLETVTRRLADAAYLRTDLVEKRGDFAVRGGILDVFPPTEEHPLRLEFWGDTIEEIRYFKVADQRSFEVSQNGLWAPPCREMLLTETVRKRAHGYASEYPDLADVFGKIAEGIAVEGMESLAPVLVDRMELLVDVLPEGTHVIVCDPERVRTRAADLVATSQEFLEASWAAAARRRQEPARPRRRLPLVARGPARPRALPRISRGGRSRPSSRTRSSPSSSEDGEVDRDGRHRALPGHGGAGLPRRGREDARRRARLAARGLARRADHGGPRPGRAARRGAARRRPRRAPGARPRGAAGARHRVRRPAPPSAAVSWTRRRSWCC